MTKNPVKFGGHRLNGLRISEPVHIEHTGCIYVTDAILILDSLVNEDKPFSFIIALLLLTCTTVPKYFLIAGNRKDLGRFRSGTWS